jgi:hypothetical protein
MAGVVRTIIFWEMDAAMYLQNIRVNLQAYTASKSRRYHLKGQNLL